MASSHIFAAQIVVALGLSGCIVAPLPDYGPAAAGGASGANGAGGAGAGGLSTGAAGGSQGASDGGVVEPAADAAPHGAWVDVTGELISVIGDSNSICGGLSMLAVRDRDGALFAGAAGGGLWISTDGGGKWSPLGDSSKIVNRPNSLVFDSDDPAVIYEAGIYDTGDDSGGGVYKAPDGLAFSTLGNVHNNDNVSIDFTDSKRRTLVAGGHERSQKLFRSSDGGGTWADIGKNLPNPSNFSSNPFVLDSHTYLVGCTGFAGGATGIFRTTDSGDTWTQVSQSGGKNMPLHASSGAFYWASDSEAGMVKSSDQGQNWVELIGKSGVVASVTPVELPDGTLASLSSQYGAQAVVVSSDDGATWKAASVRLPFQAAGFVYVRQLNAYFIWHTSCDSKTTPGAVMRYDVAPMQDE